MRILDIINCNHRKPFSVRIFLTEMISKRCFLVCFFKDRDYIVKNYYNGQNGYSRHKIYFCKDGEWHERGLGVDYFYDSEEEAIKFLHKYHPEAIIEK